MESIVRFHNALRELTGRRGIRNEVSRYEAVSLLLVDPAGPDTGHVLPSYPDKDSALRIERFFETVYLRYDQRYVYNAPDLKSVTRRREWLPFSPVFGKEIARTLSFDTLDYEPRVQIEGKDSSQAD